MLTAVCNSRCAAAKPVGVYPPPVPGGTGEPGGTSALSCCGNEWQFNTATSEPPTGQSIRLNNSDKTLATKMWITKQTSPTDDVATYLTSQAVVGRRLYIKELDDSDINAVYEITGPLVDKGTYYEVPISYVMTLPMQRVSLTILP